MGKRVLPNNVLNMHKGVKLYFVCIILSHMYKYIYIVIDHGLSFSGTVKYISL